MNLPDAIIATLTEARDKRILENCKERLYNPARLSTDLIIQPSSGNSALSFPVMTLYAILICSLNYSYDSLHNQFTWTEQDYVRTLFLIYSSSFKTFFIFPQIMLTSIQSKFWPTVRWMRNGKYDYLLLLNNLIMDYISFSVKELFH